MEFFGSPNQASRASASWERPLERDTSPTSASYVSLISESGSSPFMARGAGESSTQRASLDADPSFEENNEHGIARARSDPRFVLVHPTSPASLNPIPPASGTWPRTVSRMESSVGRAAGLLEKYKVLSSLHASYATRVNMMEAKSDVAAWLLPGTLNWLNINSKGEPLTEKEEQDTLTSCQHIKDSIYVMMTEPSSSRMAYVVSLFIFFCILLSTVSFILETVQSLSNTAAREAVFWWIECVTVQIFAAEYLIRFFTCPNKLCFVINWLNLVDLIAIVPWYVFVGISSDASGTNVFRVLRLVRVLRLFRLASKAQAMHALLLTLQSSLDELSLILLMMALLVLFASSFMYFAEDGQYDDELGYKVRPDEHVINEEGDLIRSPFYSIPAAFWWGIVTLMTVGYGDAFPITPIGKFIAGTTMLIGILSLALPISVIGNNFQSSWDLTKEGVRADGGSEGALCPSERRLVTSLKDHLLILERLNAAILESVPELGNLANRLSRLSCRSRESILAAEQRMNLTKCQDPQLVSRIQHYAKEARAAQLHRQRLPNALDRLRYAPHLGSGTADTYEGGLQGHVKLAGDYRNLHSVNGAQAGEGQPGFAPTYGEVLSAGNVQLSPHLGDGSCSLPAVPTNEGGLQGQGRQVEAGQGRQAEAGQGSRAEAGQGSRAEAEEGSEAEARQGSQVEAGTGNQAEAGPGSWAEAGQGSQAEVWQRIRAEAKDVNWSETSQNSLVGNSTGSMQMPPSQPEPHHGVAAAEGKSPPAVPLDLPPPPPPLPPDTSLPRSIPPGHQSQPDFVEGPLIAGGTSRLPWQIAADATSFYHAVGVNIQNHRNGMVVSALSKPLRFWNIPGLCTRSKQHCKLEEGVEAVMAHFLCLPPVIKRDQEEGVELARQLKVESVRAESALQASAILFDESLLSEAEDILCQEQLFTSLEKQAEVLRDNLMEVDSEYTELMMRSADLWDHLENWNERGPGARHAVHCCCLGTTGVAADSFSPYSSVHQSLQPAPSIARSSATRTSATRTSAARTSAARTSLPRTSLPRTSLPRTSSPRTSLPRIPALCSYQHTSSLISVGSNGNEPRQSIFVDVGAATLSTSSSAPTELPPQQQQQCPSPHALKPVQIMGVIREDSLVKHNGKGI